MFDLNKLVAEAYENERNKDFSFDRLVEMVESMMVLQESLGIIKEETQASAATSVQAPKEISITYNGIPDIPVSELGWGSASGEPTEVNLRREQLESFLAPVKGTYLQLNEILQKLEKFFPRDITVEAAGDVLPAYAKPGQGEIQNAMSFLIFYKALTEIMRNFNESAAGFSFESFLSVLFGGEQVPTGTGTIADLYDINKTPISLKLLRESTANVGGSYSDLVRDLIKNVDNADYKMHYLVCLKDIRGEGLSATGAIRFYRYYVNAANFLQWMRGPETSTDSKGKTKNVKARSTTENLQLPMIKVGKTKRSVPVFFKTKGGKTSLVYGMSYGNTRKAEASVKTRINQLQEAKKQLSFNLGDLEPKYQQVVANNKKQIMADLDPETKKEEYLQAMERQKGRSTTELVSTAIPLLRSLDSSKANVEPRDFLTSVLDSPNGKNAIQSYLALGYYSKDKPEIKSDNGRYTLKPKTDIRLEQQVKGYTRQALANYLGLQGRFTLQEQWDSYINTLQGNKTYKNNLKKAVKNFSDAVYKGIEQRVFDVIAGYYNQATQGLDIQPSTRVSGFATEAQSYKILKELQANDPKGFVQTLKLTRGYIETNNWEFSPKQIEDSMKAAGTPPLDGDQSDYFSGIVYIGVPNVMAFANAIKNQLDLRIFQVFEDLREMTQALESFYNSGLTNTPAAETASEEAEQIKTNVDAMASEEAELQAQADVQNDENRPFSQ